MANLEYLTNFMPARWHLNRISNKFFNFGNLLKLSSFYKTLSTNNEKGAAGEMLCAAWINRLTDQNHILINHLLVPNNHSISGDTEIDILWVNEFGVFVVEVKSFNGEVEIHNGDKWRILYPGSSYRASTMDNPIKQCMIQSRTLKAWFRDRGITTPVYGIIMLPNALKVRILDNPKLPVLYDPKGLESFLSGKTGTVVSPDQIQFI
jgi:hypothetical protein